MPATTSSQIIDRFDLAWNYLQANYGTGLDFIVSDLNQYERTFTTIPASYTNLPAWATQAATFPFGATTGNVFPYGTQPVIHAVFSLDLTQAAFSATEDFASAAELAPCEEIPVLPGYWYRGAGVATGTVLLRYAFVNSLSNIATALAVMFDMTAETLYLDDLRALVEGIASRLDINANGEAFYYRLLPGARPQYTGMGQALCIKLFNLLADRETLSEPLDEMFTALCCVLADPTKRLSEGTTNHRVNWAGVLPIVNARLGITPIIPAGEQTYLNTIMLARMTEFDGKVPQWLSAGATGYPGFTGYESYRSYDCMILTEMDSAAPGMLAALVPLLCRNLFHGITTPGREFGVYWAQCMQAVTYAARVWNITADTWVEQCFAAAMADPIEDYRAAEGVMLTLAHVLRYWKDCLESERAYLGERVMPGILFDGLGLPERV